MTCARRKFAQSKLARVVTLRWRHAEAAYRTSLLAARGRTPADDHRPHEGWIPRGEDERSTNNLRDAISSACRNQSEGFYKFKHREMKPFFNIARGSLGEALDGIRDASSVATSLRMRPAR